MKPILIILCLLALVFPIAALPRITYPAMSALVPGSAELVLGKHTRGGVMLAADLVSVLAWTSYKQDVKDFTNRYKRYANIYAGTDLNRPDWQYQHMQSYLSSDDFNDYQEMRARNYYLIYTYDPAAYDAYLARNLYTEDEAWHWQSPEHQKEFKSLRRQRQKSAQYQTLALGALLLNRAISTVDALFLSRKPSSSSHTMHIGINEDNTMMLQYTLEF
ncbi:MAG TPA: hypothetical protein PL126_04145 [Candidatus Cloacimonadota bacterium]|nr:hypothetical protein [Candidatus Cloacimonadota bacterium]